MNCNTGQIGSFAEVYGAAKPGEAVTEISEQERTELAPLKPEARLTWLERKRRTDLARRLEKLEKKLEERLTL